MANNWLAEEKEGHVQLGNTIIKARMMPQKQVMGYFKKTPVGAVKTGNGKYYGYHIGF